MALTMSNCLTFRFSNHSRGLLFTEIKQCMKSNPSRVGQHRTFKRIENCPPSSCRCEVVPEGLDIDRISPMQGAVAFHKNHLLVFTGNTNWPSKIEESTHEPLRGIKRALGKHGNFQNSAIMASASSLPALPSSPDNITIAAAFPKFKAFQIPRKLAEQITSDPDANLSFRDHLLSYVSGSQEPVNMLQPEHVSSDRARQIPFHISDFTHVVVLICGHGSRDSRCGIMGPILERQFKQAFLNQGYEMVEDLATHTPNRRSASVSLISHIGGHKFAGNVIVYIPKAYEATNELAGKGVWYGRVSLKHVDGIVEQTIENGTIISELLRGVVDENGTLIK